VSLRVDSLRADGSFADRLDTHATVVTPDQRALQLTLTPTAPGRYERRISVDQPGLYRVLLTQHDASGQDREEVFGFVVDDSLEERTMGTNSALLTSLAARTGGRSPQQPADVFTREPSAADATWRPLWRWAMAAFLTLFVLNLAVRRLRLQVALPRWRWPEHLF
jgi:hypothetical protein